MNYWKQSATNVYVAAHRGWSGKYPENTLLAFQKALELGVDQIETDVRITKDGQLVLMHDAKVDRTTNGTGRVCDYTLAELKELDAGNGEKIPTLYEFMELVKDHPTITLDIELKEYPVGDWESVAFETCDKIIAILDEYQFTDRCVINSFNGKLNEYVYEKYGDRYKQHLYFPSGAINMEGCKLPEYSFGYCACVFGLTNGTVSIAQAKEFREKTGLQLWMPCSICDEANIDAFSELGFELITCNNPDEVLRILRAKGLRQQ